MTFPGLLLTEQAETYKTGRDILHRSNCVLRWAATVQITLYFTLLLNNFDVTSPTMGLLHYAELGCPCVPICSCSNTKKLKYRWNEWRPLLLHRGQLWNQYGSDFYQSGQAVSSAFPWLLTTQTTSWEQRQLPFEYNDNEALHVGGWGHSLTWLLHCSTWTFNHHKCNADGSHCGLCGH